MRMPLHVEHTIKQLTQNAYIIKQFVENTDEEPARWKPDRDAWSILEVVNHLYDEEREDFRARVDHILHNPESPAPPIDPVGWVTTRKYNERDLAGSLANFLHERDNSIAWLRSLENPNWQTTYVAEWGSITAGDILVAWGAHDLLHMRQLVELHYQYYAQQVTPFDVRYAGEW
jgi:hypothetical protein